MTHPTVTDIYYIHRFNRYHCPIVEANVYPEFCIAYQIYDNVCVKFAVGLCSKKDPYSRPIGREQAKIRLENNQYMQLTLDEFKDVIKNDKKTFNALNMFPVKLNSIKSFYDFRRPFINFVLKYYVAREHHLGHDILKQKN